MAFKMKSLLANNKDNKVDPDAPGTPGKPGYEAPVRSMDYLTKTPVGPRVPQSPFAKKPSKRQQKKLNEQARKDEYKKKIKSGMTPEQAVNSQTTEIN